MGWQGDETCHLETPRTWAWPLKKEPYLQEQSQEERLRLSFKALLVFTRSDGTEQRVLIVGLTPEPVTAKI